jgi:large subunit ribosomal protein L9
MAEFIDSVYQKGVACDNNTFGFRFLNIYNHWWLYSGKILSLVRSTLRAKIIQAERACKDMKVLLLKDVYNLGRAGDVKKVADGYGRNFLLPKGMAVLATPGMLKQVDRIRTTATKVRELVNAEKSGLAEQLANLELKFTTKAGETGKLFGSITQQMIVDAIKEKLNVEIDRHQVESQPLREVGEHKVRVRLTFDLIPQVKVLVEAEEKKEEVNEPREARGKAPRRDRKEVAGKEEKLEEGKPEVESAHKTGKSAAKEEKAEEVKTEAEPAHKTSKAAVKEEEEEVKPEAEPAHKKSKAADKKEEVKEVKTEEIAAAPKAKKKSKKTE